MIRKFCQYIFILAGLLLSVSGYTDNLKNFSEINVVSYPQIVVNINQFRNNPFAYIYVHNGDFPDITENVRKNLFDLWRVQKPEYITGGLPELQYDKCLEQIAEENLYNISDSMAISHINKDIINSECHMLFTGETIIALAFQNYIDSDEFYNKISPLIIKKAVSLNDSETAPVTFQYNRAGAALFSGAIKVEGSTYNVYILDIVYGVFNLKYANEVYGKVENISNSATISIIDNNGLQIKNINVNSDGSFYATLPYEGDYTFELKNSNGTSFYKDIYYRFGDMLYLNFN
jgi:hypothetical protein